MPPGRERHPCRTRGLSLLQSLSHVALCRVALLLCESLLFHRFIHGFHAVHHRLHHPLLLFPVSSELFRLRVHPLPALSAAIMPTNLDISRCLEIRAEFGFCIRFRPGPRVEAVYALMSPVSLLIFVAGLNDLAADTLSLGLLSFAA